MIGKDIRIERIINRNIKITLVSRLDTDNSFFDDNFLLVGGGKVALSACSGAQFLDCIHYILFLINKSIT